LTSQLLIKKKEKRMKNQSPKIAVEFTVNSSFENTFHSNTQVLAESGLKRFSAVCLKKFNQLKTAITANLSAEFAGVLQPETVRRVVNEADALAAYTPFPALFLPVLAEEKVVMASRWQTKQRLIQERSSLLAA
jgi:hypothetical protein